MPFQVPTLAPVAAERIMTSIVDGLETVPQIENIVTATDSACTTGLCALNFCAANNVIAQTCFAAGCLCGVAGATLSGAAAVSAFCGYSVGGLAGAAAARACNRVVRYGMTVGKVTNGNVASVME